MPRRRWPASEAASEATPSIRSPSLTIDVGVVVDDREVRAVEVRGEEALGDGHAHAVGEALAQRAGGRLDAGREAVLGVAGGAAAPLAELLQLLERQVVAGQVEQGVEQHASRGRRRARSGRGWASAGFAGLCLR